MLKHNNQPNMVNRILKLPNIYICISLKNPVSIRITVTAKLQQCCSTADQIWLNNRNSYMNGFTETRERQKKKRVRDSGKMVIQV